MAAPASKLRAVRNLAPGLLLLFVACGERGPAPAPPDPKLQARAEAKIAAAGCTGCHAAADDVAARLVAVPAPGLPGAFPRWSQQGLAERLQRHHGGDRAAAVAMFVRAQARGGPLQQVPIDGATIARGERIWQQAGCATCHEPGGIAGLAEATDHGALVQFLREPQRRPDLRAHRFVFGDGEPEAVAAFLMRDQLRDGANGAAQAGLHFECFELKIDAPTRPVLDGLAPKAEGHVEVPDVKVRTRDNHFALRFRGELLVPLTGSYRFVIGSDDSSWLTIDGVQRIANEALAPHRRREAAVVLEQGPHTLELLYTEAAGEQTLEFLWQVPGGKLEPVPTTAMRAMASVLQPPPEVPIDPTLVEQGRVAFAEQQCGACHRGEGLPAPASPAPPWHELHGDNCPRAPWQPLPEDLALARTGRGTRSPAGQLEFDLARDGCRSCHVRDGRGGVRAAAASLLAEREDLGDEGRLPPALDRAGARLRAKWIERLLGEGRRAREYLTLRMPIVEPALAAAYAANFAATDAGTDTDEPKFDPAAVAEGCRLVGTTGHSCITCHAVGDRQALGARGMDLLLQHERLRPAWFRDWLAHPNELRPGTRMPNLWPGNAAAAHMAADAIRSWMSLGSAAPLPKGFPPPGGLVLDASERVVLHGAFLDGLSARCVVVGSPLRTHLAYDIANLRLAWLWRGAFVDADGTWTGRAGKLLRPLGSDAVVLPEGCAFTAGDAAPRALGWTVDGDGYPQFRVGLGDVVVTDAPRPRLREGGSELVRTVRAQGGRATMRLPPVDGVTTSVGGKPVTEVAIGDGEIVEVVYRW